MQRRHLIWLLATFVSFNLGILIWVWRHSSRSPLDDQREARERASKEFEKTSALAYDLIATWNSNPTLALTSNELEAQIRSLPDNGCVQLPNGAIPVAIDSLPTQVRSDLDTAITGLLRAYVIGGPNPMINYMRERGQKLNPAIRKAIETSLSKRGVPNSAALSDEDLYRRMWITFAGNSHWSGVVIKSSCRQSWDGKNVPLAGLKRFDINSSEDTSSAELEQAAYLFRIFHGDDSPRHSFISTTGSLEEATKKHERLLLCDTQLIIELDESQFHVKAAYLVRFWFNNRLQKWQPVTIKGFSSEPTRNALPLIMF